MEKLSVKIIIPTFNAGEKFKEVLNALLNQDGITKNDILIVDSSSNDGTSELVQALGINIIVIPKNEFGHGRTRKMAAQIASDVDIVIFMTQDALPYNRFAIRNIYEYFKKDDKITAVYGRQVPYQHTDIFDKHARLFNYSEKSYIRSVSDKEMYGIKTAFFSDTFGAYKRNILETLGSFPDVEFGEDTCMAAKFLLAGYKVGYCAEAKVYHSHTFTVVEEYRRYKEIGKFYKSENWLLETFGKAEGEGMRFVKSQIAYLLKNGKWYLLPELIVRNGIKYLGYKFS